MARKTPKQYADEYNCTPRTARNWLKEGAPLDKPMEMAEWIAARHRGPSGEPPTVGEPQDASNDHERRAPATIQDAKLRKLVLECERLQARIDEDKKDVIRMSVIEPWVQALAAAVESAFDVIVADAPNWSGMVPSRAQAKAREVKRRIVEELHAAPRRLLRAA